MLNQPVQGRCSTDSFGGAASSNIHPPGWPPRLRVNLLGQEGKPTGEKNKGRLEQRRKSVSGGVGGGGGWREGGVLGFVRAVKEREREQEISFDGLPVFNFQC